MRRVDEALKLKSLGKYNSSEQDILWSLMCPKKCPGLTDVYGEEFEELYTRYEREGRYNKQINVLLIWDMILTAQKETGTPYMCYKDSINKKSQQKNIGIIKSSNLCAEIYLYSDDKEYALKKVRIHSLGN
jgi:ribonucleotide reductase alpha subunit